MCVDIPSSCLVFTTTEKEGDVFIAVETLNEGWRDLGEVFISFENSWQYCFAPGHLLHYEVKNTNGNSWVGDVRVTHADDTYETMMMCTEHCDCECGDLTEEQYLVQGCYPCIPRTDFSLGVDSDDNVNGDIKCRHANHCLFQMTWTNTPKCADTMIESCQSTCSDDFGDCKCINTGWGDQCITCPPGNIIALL